jgi:LysR family glycine cleavage system transcriptional activator
MKPSLRSAPLNGLRAFEAAARRLSFAAAAEELFVTPGAISHQIAGLEDFLGMKLFVRGTRSVALTARAEACLPLLTRGFATLHRALTVLQGDGAARPLTVDVAPAFATRWLLPRLSAFTNDHPEVALRVSTSLGLIDEPLREAGGGPADAPEQTADVSIRFGRGHYPGSSSEKLLEVEVTPVCSPRLLDAAAAVAGLDVLRHATLLHDDTAYFDAGRDDWAVWLSAAGVDEVDATRGPRFSHTALTLDAAEDGIGFALGLTALTARDIAAGRLVAPFALKLRSHFAYHLVYHASLDDRTDLKIFRDWVVAEAAQDETRQNQRDSAAGPSPPRPTSLDYPAPPTSVTT